LRSDPARPAACRVYDYAHWAFGALVPDVVCDHDAADPTSAFLDRSAIAVFLNTRWHARPQDCESL